MRGRQRDSRRRGTRRSVPAGPGACEGAVCGIDAGEDPGWLRHADGTLEEIIHLGSPPAYTDAAWLSHLLCCPLPTTLAVHIAVGGRAREQARQRRRWKRLRAAVLYKERRDRVVGSDEHGALEEAATVDAELAAEIGASVYRVGIYCSIRDPHGRLEQFKRTVRQAASEFHALTNARVIRGRRLCLPGFTSTLPLGVDELLATRSYAQRNIAHCIALTSSRCGSPGGVIVGTADPGGTIERADPFDPVHPRRVTLIVGPSGGGKTVLTNALCLRYIAQGGRTFILDRSSTPDEHGNTKGTGHYDTLASLIPGSRRVQVGHAGGDVICPWDVADPARVPAHKTELLLALHALLIGHAHDPEGRIRTLDSDEETLIRTGIEAAYRLASETGERPREQLLIDVLSDRADSGALKGANADRLQSLLLRLEPFGEEGSLAHIADRATSVPADTPLTLFDFTGLSERLTPALMLATVEYVERQVQRLRRARVDGALDHLGAWAGKCQLIVEEGWALTQSPAAGAWLNEYARRSRHYALWLMFVSQHFRDLVQRTGTCAARQRASELLPAQRSRRSGARPRAPRALRHRHRPDPGAPQAAGRLLHGLHGLGARPRRGPRRARRPRVLDLLLGSRARPAPAGRRAARVGRRRLGGAGQALQSQLARAIPPTQRSRRMIDPRLIVVAEGARRSRQALPWLLAAGAFMIVISPVVLFAGAGNPPCQAAAMPTLPAGAGSWIATAYGPPWDAMNGSGVTATGLNLTAGQPAYEIAVDPSVIPLQSFERVTPNPFGTRHAFYAGDTGGAIIGHHVDIYDWLGRAAQNAWGIRHVTVTPAPTPGTGNLLGEITPAAATQPAASASSDTCWSARRHAPSAHPRPAGEDPADGLAAAPTDAPAAVKLAIAAGNQLISKPYVWGGGHGVPLSQLDSGYDCSGATSYILHAAGRWAFTRKTRRRSRASASRAGCLDHRLRELGPRVHRSRRNRDEHGVVRTGQANRPF